MKGIIALRMCDMSKYGGLPLEYGTVPAPVWRNIHPRLRMGTAARARAGVGLHSRTRTVGAANETANSASAALLLLLSSSSSAAAAAAAAQEEGGVAFVVLPC